MFHFLRKNHIRIALLLLFVLVIYIAFTQIGDQSKFSNPCSDGNCNIILVVVDALSAKHMSLYGYERETTPILDDYFSNNSVVFENAWSPAPWTLLSFSSLYTSQYPSDISSEIFNGKKNDPNLLPSILKANGVRPAFNSLVCPFCKALQEISSNFDNISRDPLEETVGLIEMWNESGGQNFFVLHNYTAHMPYNPPEEYLTLFGSDRNKKIITKNYRTGPHGGFDPQNNKKDLKKMEVRYDQDVRYTDKILGDFFESLSSSVENNSIIILTADHGEAFGEHGNLYHGNNLYEENLHIPLAIKIPGLEQKRVDTPVSLIDIAPTALDLFGHNIPSHFDGESLTPLLKGYDFNERIIRAEMQNESSFSDLWTVARRLSNNSMSPRLIDFSDGYKVAFRSDVRWKLIANYSRESLERMEVYNLKKDPLEQNDLFLNKGDGISEETPFSNLIQAAKKFPEKLDNIQ